MAKRSRTSKSNKSRKTPRTTRSGRKPARSKLPRGRRRFTLPNRGGRTLYVSPDRYPRLYEWIRRAEEDE